MWCHFEKAFPFIFEEDINTGHVYWSSADNLLSISEMQNLEVSSINIINCLLFFKAVSGLKNIISAIF